MRLLRRLAEEMHRRRQNRQPAYVLVILNSVDLTNASSRTATINRAQPAERPPELTDLACAHLAQMVATGFIQTVVTEVYEPRLDASLLQMAPLPSLGGIAAAHRSDVGLPKRKNTLPLIALDVQAPPANTLRALTRRGALVLTHRSDLTPGRDQLPTWIDHHSLLLVPAQHQPLTGRCTTDADTGHEFFLARLNVALQRQLSDGGGRECRVLAASSSKLSPDSVILPSTTQLSPRLSIFTRPWGQITEMVHDSRVTVRLLEIQPWHRLSLQRHHLRDELFMALDDEVELTVCRHSSGTNTHARIRHTRVLRLQTEQSILVPKSTWHRLAARRRTARVLEVSSGLYDQINDIERAGDDYGRLTSDGSV